MLLHYLHNVVGEPALPEVGNFMRQYFRVLQVPGYHQWFQCTDVPEGQRLEQESEGGGEATWPVTAWAWRDSWSWNLGCYNSWDRSQGRLGLGRSSLSQYFEKDDEELSHILPDAVLGWFLLEKSGRDMLEKSVIQVQNPPTFGGVAAAQYLACGHHRAAETRLTTGAGGT